VKKRREADTKRCTPKELMEPGKRGTYLSDALCLKTQSRKKGRQRDVNVKLRGRIEGRGKATKLVSRSVVQVKPEPSLSGETGEKKRGGPFAERGGSSLVQTDGRCTTKKGNMGRKGIKKATKKNNGGSQGKEVN